MELKRKDKRDNLRKERDRLILDMMEIDQWSDEYQEKLDRLKQIVNVESQAKDIDLKGKSSLSKDKILESLVSVIGLFAIMHYEQLKILGGKAFNWIRKPRI